MRLEQQIRAHWDRLTKPPGSLGKLEELVVRYGAIRKQAVPILNSKALFVFCADHGIVEEGVAAYPASVTAAMVQNFWRGGAAINVLCRHYGIQPFVIDMGVKGPLAAPVLNARIAEGTGNFLRGPAMTRVQAQQAIDAGIRLTGELGSRFDIVAAGEMGIGNTTAAAAILSAFSGQDAAECCGRGSGVDDAGLQRKIAVVRQALLLHRPDPADGLGILAAVGGFEIGAIAGLILGAHRAGLAVVLDGFISCSAALIARAIQPGCLDSILFSHRSAERGHTLMLDHLGAEPYLQLDMRLGEGTGAALLIGLLEASLKLYREMATLDQLGNLE